MPVFIGRRKKAIHSRKFGDDDILPACLRRRIKLDRHMRAITMHRIGDMPRPIDNQPVEIRMDAAADGDGRPRLRSGRRLGFGCGKNWQGKGQKGCGS